jgi:membrane fusion protein (multidrug efflux system)
MKRNSTGFIILSVTLLVLQSCGGKTEENEIEQKLNPLVSVEKVESKNFIHQIRVQGNVETDQDITLSSEMGGLITSINVKEGQKVSKGTIIATVDAAILASNLNEIETQLDYAKYMLSKQEELKKRGVGSEFELETAKNQVNSLKSRINSLSTQKGKAVLRAPFSGVIDQVFARQGQMAGPASPIVRLVNNNNVDIVAGISEKHLANVKVGTEIEVSFPNFKDTIIRLQLTNVGNYIEPTNRTFRIMATIKNNTLLLPNMLAEISITDKDIPNGLVVPAEAILKDQSNQDFLFIAVKTNNEYLAKKVNVEVIDKYNGEALVKESSNIKKDVMIIVKGAKGIVDKDIVRIN